MKKSLVSDELVVLKNKIIETIVKIIENSGII